MLKLFQRFFLRPKLIRYRHAYDHTKPELIFKLDDNAEVLPIGHRLFFDAQGWSGGPYTVCEQRVNESGDLTVIVTDPGRLHGPPCPL